MELWDENNVCNAGKMAMLNEQVEKLKEDIMKMETAMKENENN